MLHAQNLSSNTIHSSVQRSCHTGFLTELILIKYRFFIPSSGSDSKSRHYICGRLFSSFLWQNVITHIYSALTPRGGGGRHCLSGKKKVNILQPSLHSCSGKIGGSAEDLLRDVDSWAHSAGRWVSDTRMRLWNRTGVIPGHLHTASIPIGGSYQPSLSSPSSLHTFLVCPSVCLWFFIFFSFFSPFQIPTSPPNRSKRPLSWLSPGSQSCLCHTVRNVQIQCLISLNHKVGLR